jgi:hypothetical protein
MEKLKSEILNINLLIAQSVMLGQFIEASNLRLLLNVKIDQLISLTRKMKS